MIDISRESSPKRTSSLEVSSSASKYVIDTPAAETIMRDAAKREKIRKR